MDRIRLSTVIYRPPADVFPYLRDFTRYPRYAKHLESVTADGDGGAGTRYALHLSWWKLSYTARSEVTEISDPTSLRWRLIKDIEAAGEWRVETAPDVQVPADARVAAGDDSDARTGDEGTASASRVYFEALYDPHSASKDVVSLPRFVSWGWVIDKLRPRLMEEARRVLERLVEDIEGVRRPVELTVHEMP